MDNKIDSNTNNKTNSQQSVPISISLIKTSHNVKSKFISESAPSGRWYKGSLQCLS